jgi:hypothetical protein
MGDPDNGIIAIVARAAAGQMCMFGANPKEPPDLPGIRISYDPSDLSSDSVLRLIKGMEGAGVLPRMYAWEERNRGEVAILFDYRNPPEALWRKIAGIEGLCFNRCVKIFATYEPDYPLDAWRNCLKGFREKGIFVLQVLSGNEPWVQFILTAVETSKPAAMK